MGLDKEARRNAERGMVKAQASVDRTWATLRGISPDLEQTLRKLEPYKDIGLAHLDDVDVRRIIMALNVVATEETLRSLRKRLEESS